MNLFKKFEGLRLINGLKKQKQKYIHFFLSALDTLGINALFGFINRKKMVILLFHGISNKSLSYDKHRFYPISILLKEIIYLKRKKYQFITLSDWVHIVKNQTKISCKYVILTFDDGLKNVIDNAYPIMKKHDAKGCIYVISDIVGKDQLLWTDYIEILVRNLKIATLKFKFKDKELNYPLASEINIQTAIKDIKTKLRSLDNQERILHLNQFTTPNKLNNFSQIPEDYLIADWASFKSLDKNILEVGGHTRTHPNLEFLNSENELSEELLKSKKQIEKEIGSPISHLCYPDGSYNKDIINYAKKCGYLTGVTLKRGLNTVKTDLFQLKRISMNEDFLMSKCKISGLYSFLVDKLKIPL